MSKHLERRQIDQAINNLKSAATGATRAAERVTQAKRSLQQAESAMQRAQNTLHGGDGNYSLRSASDRANADYQGAQREVEQAERAHQSAMDALGKTRSEAQQLLREVEAEQRAVQSDAQGISGQARQVKGGGARAGLDQTRSALDADARRFLSWANDLQRALRQSASAGQSASASFGGGGGGLERLLGGGGASRGAGLFGAYQFKSSYYPSVEQQLQAKPYLGGPAYGVSRVTEIFQTTYTRVVEYLPRLYR